MKKYYERYKHILPYLVGVILLALLLSGGRYGYSYHKQEITRLNDSISSYKENKEALLKEYQTIQTQTQQQKENIKSYYYEYQQERQKTKELQKRLNDISSLIFNREYLDSLARSIEYR